MLVVHVRIVSCTTDSLCDEFLFLDFLSVKATVEPIFNTLPVYLVSNDIPFSHIIGAAEMVGRYIGSISRLKTMAPQVNAIHCALYRENLEAKRLNPPSCSSSHKSQF